jgi:hypothetical protein
MQPRYRISRRQRPFVDLVQLKLAHMSLPECAWCQQRVEVSDGTSYRQGIAASLRAVS